MSGTEAVSQPLPRRLLAEFVGSAFLAALDVNAQLLDRRKREHGVAFDALLAGARRTLYGPQQEGFGPPFGPPSSATPDTAYEPSEQNTSLAGHYEARPGRFERPTSRSGGERSIH